MPGDLTPTEQARLQKIEAALDALKRERAALLNLRRQRRFRARQKARD